MGTHLVQPGLRSQRPLHASADILVATGRSSLEVPPGLVECLVKEYGNVLTGTDIQPNGMGTFTIRISRPPEWQEG